MSVTGLYFFHCGNLELDKSMITYRLDMGRKIQIPVFASLIETTDGFILFDTGLNPLGIDDPTGTWNEHVRGLIMDFGPQFDLRAHLAQMGLQPEDIRFVINSHLHYDHTGANRFFSHAQFFVQKAEYRFALYPDRFASGPYLKDHFDMGINYTLLEGDVLLFEDVYLMLTPGHSPGHQSLLLRLPKGGTALLAGDAIFCQENIEKKIHSGNCWNAALAMDSMQRIVQTARRENAQLFITHDAEACNRIKPYPYCYR
jgi:N-acyl homoserine lactone hydrolase